MQYIRKEFSFKEEGAFFAFTDSQFEEGKDKNKTKKDYVSHYGGLILPKDKAISILEKFESHNKRERERRIKIMGIDAIIKYELANHEAWFTGSLRDTMDALVEYDVSESQVARIYNRYADECDSF